MCLLCHISLSSFTIGLNPFIRLRLEFFGITRAHPHRGAMVSHLRETTNSSDKKQHAKSMLLFLLFFTFDNCYHIPTLCSWSISHHWFHLNSLSVKMNSIKSTESASRSSFNPGLCHDKVLSPSLLDNGYNTVSTFFLSSLFSWKFTRSLGNHTCF